MSASEGKMKKLLLGSVMLLALSGVNAALATDLPPPSMPLKAPPMAPLAFSWNGFYVGGTGGGAWGNSNYTETPTGAWLLPAAIGGGLNAAPIVAGVGTGTVSPRGFIGGGEIGFNSQVGSIVWGLEADISGWDMSKTAVVSAPGVVPGTTFTSIDSIGSTWLATVRPRLGWASSYWLFYATGGLAFSNVSFAQSIILVPPQAGAFSNTMGGWTVGGGIEYALSRNWSIKGEYLYIDFMNQSVSQFNPGFPTFTGTATGNLTASIARAGINYRF
jgi:outer membrane immunogenic protein